MPSTGVFTHASRKTSLHIDVGLAITRVTTAWFMITGAELDVGVLHADDMVPKVQDGVAF